MASKVHRVRFYNPKPQPINCISFSKQLKLIALARGDSSIEVWDLNHAPHLVRFIPGIENGSVEALGWVDKRLLSTGLSGSLVEWDIPTLQQKRAVLLTGYAAWCLDVNTTKALVAVGTEQGYINLYSVENDDIVYKKLFDKQDGRIICCKFDNAGNVVVTGSVDTIRVWNVETGHAITRLSVSRRKKEVMVWSLAILSDNTIVSGDSHGRLTFWDGTLGEQIESYTSHKADILSLAVSEDETNIYCSGLDPTISHFVKVNKGSKQQPGAQWVKNVQRHIHEHDVRVLVVNDKTLISVGVDGYLTFSSYPPKWVMRVPPMIPTPRSSVCSKKMILLRYSNYLEVWKLGSYAINKDGDVMISNISTKENNKQSQKKVKIEQDSTISISNGVNKYKNKQHLKLTENPVKIASIQTKHRKQIQCCEMSPSGEFIFYSTHSDVRLLKLETDDTDDDDQPSISLTKVMINGLAAPCDRVAFTEDSRTMVVNCDSSLKILEVDPDAGATVVQTIPTDNFLKTPSILHLLVSKKTTSGATYIVAADTCGAIEVFINKKRKFGRYVSLPKYKCVPSAMTVDSERETLIVVYVDQKVIEYNLVQKMLTDWPGSWLPVEWHARKSAVVSVTVHPRRNALAFQDDTSLWILERDSQVNDEEPQTKRKNQYQKPLGVNIIPIKYLAGFHWVGDDEAVMLEILPENIVSQLPPSTHVNNWQIRA